MSFSTVISRQGSWGAGMLRAVLLLVLVVMPGLAVAQDYWGRKLPGQPMHFIFGYGSLINTQSRNATSDKPIPAVPARIAKDFGYLRAWVFKSTSGFTALGLRKPRPDESPATINGVIYPVEGGDMEAFDAREVGYRRVEVPLDLIEPLSWQQLPPDGKIWIYVSVGDDGETGSPVQGGPTSDFPLLQSYIDIVVEGGLEYGDDYLRELIATTADWNKEWLDDRELPRRPWVFRKNAVKIDKALREVSPASDHFKDRLFPEAFAVKRLLAPEAAAR